MAGQASREGLVHLYYGPGKGKTTAAMGLALRASGHGSKVLVLQFMKGAEEMREQYGEVQQFENIPQVKVEQYPAGHARTAEDLSPEERRILESALDTATETVSEGTRRVVVLDEILTLYALDVADSDRLVDIAEARDESVEVVFTGREAPAALVDASDYVSYVGNVKHPFEQGIGPRPGIEY